MAGTSPENLRRLAADLEASASPVSKTEIVDALREFADLMQIGTKQMPLSDAQIEKAARVHYRERSGHGDWKSLSPTELKANLRWMRAALKAI